MSDVIWSAFIAAGAALGASGLTYLVTNRGISAAAQEGTRNRDHDREIHAQDRAFERKSDTCVAVATSISWMQDCVTYWNQQITLSDPNNTLRRLPSLGGDDVDSPPSPPESYKETMSALSRLFLDKATQDQVEQVLTLFIRYQAIVAFLRSQAVLEGSAAVAVTREKLVAQAKFLGGGIHTHAASSIELLRTEVERQMN